MIEAKHSTTCEGGYQKSLEACESQANTSRTVAKEASRSTVLIIDDKAVPQRAFVRQANENNEYHVLEITDWRVALQICIQQLPRCVLLDFEHVGRVGLEVCRRIRTLRQMTDTTILLLTLDRSVQLFDAALIAGADEVLFKPLPDADLLMRLQSTLQPERYTRTELQGRCARLRQQRAQLEAAIQPR